MARMPRALRDALRGMERDMRNAFVSAIRRGATQADMDAMAAAIARQDIRAAAAIAGISEARLSILEDPIREGYTTGGRGVVDDLPRLRDPTTGARQDQVFNGRHQRAQAAIAAQSGQLITGLVEGQIETFRAVTISGLAADRPPAAIARDLVGTLNPATGLREGGFIGLDAVRQERAETVRSILADPDEISRYFIRDAKTGRMKPRYTTTDRRFDREIKAAIAQGRAISRRRIEEMAKAHRNKLLASRGNTIARTEMLQAMRAGRREAIEQITESGAVRRDEIVREWSTAGDSRVRDDHVEMDGQIVEGLDTPFTLPDGRPVMEPDEPNCRCVVIMRIKRS